MEIRRSVMARPNLSVRGMLWNLQQEKKQAGHVTMPRPFPFQLPLSKQGGDGVSTNTLGMRTPLAAKPWYAEGRRGRKLTSIIDARMGLAYLLSDTGRGRRCQ